jgi:serine/threonine-protein kinase
MSLAAQGSLVFRSFRLTFFPFSSTMPAPVEQLGPYRLGAKLGQGGMGSVYVGVDGEDKVAVKVLAPNLACEEGFRVRFEAEIDSLKKLRHPNIVRLFGYGEQDGYLYYAMEMVEGTSLEDELRRGRRFNWREVTKITIAICRALKHAHDHGIIHRDIKPANLLLSPSGDVKLSDFGIARLFGNTRMTGEGGVLGTAEYMAPEQADGRVVTDRCDQYSLGGVMYALLSGRPPFRANSLLEMLQMQRFAEPQPVRYLAPDTPTELERIILQLLSKDPQKRFSNTLLLSRALEAMELGIQRGLRRDDFVVQSDGGTNVRLTQSDPLAATLAPETNAPLGKSSASRSTGMNVTKAATDVRSLAGESDDDDLVEETPVNRFTKVGLEQEETVSWQREFFQNLGSPQALLSLLGLLALALTAVYLLQPATADQTYQKITQLISSDEKEKLVEAEPLVDEFLLRYPQDARSPEVVGFRDQITLARLERRFEFAARRASKVEGLSPPERAYLDAMRLIESRPERALERFRALLDLCDTGSAGTQTENNLRELSRRQVARLERQVKENADADRHWAERELERATELAEQDPDAAHKIRQAVVALMAEKPEMADVVQAAREKLGDKLGSRD